jgi:hypothetical protein
VGHEADFICVVAVIECADFYGVAAIDEGASGVDVVKRMLTGFLPE